MEICRPNHKTFRREIFFVRAFSCGIFFQVMQHKCVSLCHLVRVCTNVGDRD